MGQHNRYTFLNRLNHQQMPNKLKFLKPLKSLSTYISTDNDEYVCTDFVAYVFGIELVFRCLEFFDVLLKTLN